MNDIKRISYISNEIIKNKERTHYIYLLSKLAGDALLFSFFLFVFLTHQNIFLSIFAGLFLGILQVSWFEAMHFCTHNSLFRSAQTNKWFGHFCAFMCVRPFLYYRSSHLAHHRYLGDENNDPEQLDGGQILKENAWLRIRYQFVSSTKSSISAIIRLFRLAFFASEQHRLQKMPYVTQKTYSKLVIECRVLLTAYTAFGLVIVKFASLEVLLVSPLIVWVHNFCNILFATPEHAGINQFSAEREAKSRDRGLSKIDVHIEKQMVMTRLFTTNALIRYLRWNENFHAAHHAYPGAPFYSLRKISIAMGEEFPNRRGSYLAFLLLGDRKNV